MTIHRSTAKLTLIFSLTAASASAEVPLYQMSFEGSDVFPGATSVSQLSTFDGDFLDARIDSAVWTPFQTSFSAPMTFNSGPSLPGSGSTTPLYADISPGDSIRLTLGLSSGTRVRVDEISFDAGTDFSPSSATFDIWVNSAPITGATPDGSASAGSISGSGYTPNSIPISGTILTGTNTIDIGLDGFSGGSPELLAIDNFKIEGAIGKGQFTFFTSSIDFGQVIRNYSAEETLSGSGESFDGSDAVFTAIATGDAQINSFPIAADGFDDGLATLASVDVGIDTTALGAVTGTVEAFDGGGSQFFDVTGEIVNHSNASLASSSDTDALTVNLGDFEANQGEVQELLANLITNIEEAGGDNAAMDFDEITELSDDGQTDLAILFSQLGSGDSGDAEASIDTAGLANGDYQAVYNLGFSDDNLVSGRSAFASDTVELTIGYTIVPEPTSLALLGLGGFVLIRRRQ